jgi:hypothetical protein
MKTLAKSLLEKLLADSEKAAVGRRSKQAVLTKSHLSKYHACKTLQEKDEFETVINVAKAEGAIQCLIGTRGSVENFIERIELIDSDVLAKLLNRVPAEVTIRHARNLLTPFADRYPIIHEVLNQWALLKTVRTFTAADAQDWVDAITVIEYARNNMVNMVVLTPVKEVSSKLFKNSKRIQELAAPIDVLLSGDIDAYARVPSEVLEEIGLLREEHPVRLAGNIVISRDRVTDYIDTPYMGLPAANIKSLVSIPSMVLTIENPTTFHSEARRRCNEDVLLIYTAGMPNPPWRDMYARLLKSLPSTVPVYHWGDLDEGGFRIASVLASVVKESGHTLLAWKMHPEDVPVAHRRPASVSTTQKMVYFAKAAGWSSIADAIEESKFTVEQESLS